MLTDERFQTMVHDLLPATHSLGALGVSVGPPVRGAESIVEELRPIQRAAPGAGLEVRFVESIEPAHGESFYLPVAVDADNGFRISRRHLDYRVDYLDDRVVLSVAPRVVHRPRIKLVAERWRDWNYLTHAEKTAKTFFYEVFDYLTQTAQLPLGQTWLHSGAVERDGEAVLFAGWGGVGKTTATLRLCLEQGYRFLSDDFGVLDRGGRFYRGPKKLQVYGYNLVGEAELERRLMAGRGPLDRTSWNHRLKASGPSGVRRRTAAERLLGADRTAGAAQVATVLLIERGDVGRPVHKELSADDFARRSAATAMRELAPFGDISNSYHSADVSLDRPHLPTVAETAERMTAIIREGVEGLPITQITLPRSAGPTDVVREVAPHL